MHHQNARTPSLTIKIYSLNHEEMGVLAYFALKTLHLENRCKLLKSEIKMYQFHPFFKCTFLSPKCVNTIIYNTTTFHQLWPPTNFYLFSPAFMLFLLLSTNFYHILSLLNNFYTTFKNFLPPFTNFYYLPSIFTNFYAAFNNFLPPVAKVTTFYQVASDLYAIILKIVADHMYHHLL